VGMSRARVLDKADVSYLDDILLADDGYVAPVPADELKNIPDDHLRQWCGQNAIYQIPTEELIEWLRERINGRKTIEIGSGHVMLGRWLDIPCTDSYVQTTPEMLLYYSLIQQRPISPPEKFVEKLEALEAVAAHKPDVVIGSFITQKFQEGDKEKKIGSSVYGINEEEMLKHVNTYIHIGNQEIHGDKRIASLPHEEFMYDWLYSRAFNPAVNVIGVWS